MAQGVRLPRRALYEIMDLYKWGARMQDLEDLYGYNRQTIRSHLKMHGVKMRAAHAPTLAEAKPHKKLKPNHADRPHSETHRVKSSRPRLPAGARVVDGSPTPDQLLRSSARAQRDKRTVERRSGASTGSYPAAASECRYAFLRSGNRLPDLE